MNKALAAAAAAAIGFTVSSLVAPGVASAWPGTCLPFVGCVSVPVDPHGALPGFGGLPNGLPGMPGMPAMPAIAAPPVMAPPVMAPPVMAPPVVAPPVLAPPVLAAPAPAVIAPPIAPPVVAPPVEAALPVAAPPSLPLPEAIPPAPVAPALVAPAPPANAFAPAVPEAAAPVVPTAPLPAPDGVTTGGPNVTPGLPLPPPIPPASPDAAPLTAPAPPANAFAPDGPNQSTLPEAQAISGLTGAPLPGGAPPVAPPDNSALLSPFGPSNPNSPEGLAGPVPPGTPLNVPPPVQEPGPVVLAGPGSNPANNPLPPGAVNADGQQLPGTTLTPPAAAPVQTGDSANPYSICMGEGTCNASGGPVGTPAAVPGPVTPAAAPSPDATWNGQPPISSGVPGAPPANAPGFNTMAQAPPECVNPASAAIAGVCEDIMSNPTGPLTAPAAQPAVAPNQSDSANPYSICLGEGTCNASGGPVDRPAAPAPAPQAYAPNYGGLPLPPPISSFPDPNAQPFPGEPLPDPIPPANIPMPDNPSPDTQAMINGANGAGPLNGTQVADGANPNVASDAPNAAQGQVPANGQQLCDPQDYACDAPIPIQPNSDAAVFARNNPGAAIPPGMSRISKVDANGNCPDGSQVTWTSGCNYTFSGTPAPPAAQPATPQVAPAPNGDSAPVPLAKTCADMGWVVNGTACAPANEVPVSKGGTKPDPVTAPVVSPPSGETQGPVTFCGPNSVCSNLHNAIGN